MRIVVFALLLALACKGDDAAADPKQAVELAAVAADTLCATHGQMSDGGKRVAAPTFRAVVRGGGDASAASITFTANGQSEKTRALASGQLRRQIGLKLHAENGCNLVYVMWRLDPKPMVEVSVKRNPGKRNNKECGNGGYTKVRPDKKRAVPALEYGRQHVLAAELSSGALVAWIDGRVAWRGELPPDAGELRGPAGLRSDNLDYELASFAVDSRAGIDAHAKCKGDDDEGDKSE
jgi:hypothetical protein